MTQVQITSEQLAVEFAKVLRSWLPADEMAKVIILNQNETDKGVCHSHDFCDANTAMLEAVGNLTDLSTDDTDELSPACVWLLGDGLDTVNSAWDIAKASGFSTK
jgi:hypothetical protein